MKSMEDSTATLRTRKLQFLAQDGKSKSSSDILDHGG